MDGFLGLVPPPRTASGADNPHCDESNKPEPSAQIERNLVVVNV